MPKERIYQIAKKLGITSKELISALDDMGMPGLKAANSVDEDEATLIVNLYKEGQAPAEEVPSPKKETPVKKGPPRPPVVSVLGHIDHGKTTLLDAIRDSRLAGKEAGGITQTIGAYQADLHGQKITFIDTPGHKAFTGMRARGAQATDIAILVVAADDGVMAQTVEAIDHIRAAGIPMIVAINKVDKANADVDSVYNGLTKYGLTPEAWGGDTITVPISALNREKIDDVLEMILLVAEMQDLRADPEDELEAIVIESHLDTGRGPVATAVIRNGTLRDRECIVAGSTYGRVKALMDENGTRVPEALPGKAVEILGLQGLPAVGAAVEKKKDQNEAKCCAEARQEEEKVPRQSRARMSVEDLFREAREEEKLQIILKAASSGALEAARREIESIGIEDVELEFLHTGVGAVSESDVLLASSVADNCLVIGFGVKPSGKAAKLAEREGVIILIYEVIYDLVDEIERALKRMLAPEYQEMPLGTAEVRELFEIRGSIVAGCYVSEGKIVRSGKVHIVRNGDEVFTGDIASLHRFADDVREVQNGRECGIRVKDFDDFRVGDLLSVFALEEVKR